MPDRWVVEVPAWGQRCVESTIRYGLPSLKAAMSHSPGEYRFLVHTDAPEILTPHFEGLSAEFRVVPESKDDHHALGNCHRAAIEYATPGDYVVPGTGDIVYSREVFSSMSKRFAEGKKLIICAASRCLLQDWEPPIGATAEKLLDWTMANRHPTIRELFWGTGTSGCPWCLYFKTDHGIILRGLHLHPLGVVKRAGLKFHGVNVDETLASEFSRDDIHVVTAKEELALAELSPPDRLFALYNTPIDVKRVFKWAVEHSNRRHHWLFSHRIVIQGTDKGISDIAPCNHILEKLKFTRIFCYGTETPEDVVA